MKRAVCVVMAVALSAGPTVLANLLMNPSFETQGSGAKQSAYWEWDVPSGWTMGGYWGQFERETWNHSDGSYALHFKGEWSGLADYGGGWQAATISPNTYYTLSGDFYWDNGWSAAFQAFKLEFFDSGNNMLAAYTNRLSDLPESNWVTRTISAMSPASAARAQVVFEFSNAGAGGVLAGDNFNLDVGVIPEPATAALAGLGLAVAAARLRKLRRS